MKKHYQHIIWDWNGTLINDMWLCVDILNPLLEKYGQPPISHPFYLKHFDFPVKNFYKKAGFDFDRVPFEIVGTEWMDIYRQRWRECSLHSQARQLLQDLRMGGISQSIVSASDLNLLNECLHHFDLEACFIKISGLDNHFAHGKIDIARHHIQELGIQSDKIIFIGDTLHDYHVARSIGVDCILFSGGHHSKNKLLTTKTPVIDSLDEIRKILDK